MTPLVQREAKGDVVADVESKLSGASDPGRALGNLGSGGGSPLDSGVASKVEGATGASLGDVRVHTGEDSQQAAASLGARAFTFGSDIHLGAGQSTSDTHLMAHEATHTIQQGGGGGGGAIQAKSMVSTPGDAFEQEADAVADAVVSGGNAEVSFGAGSVIQRDVVSDVEEKLSYGVFDWAITDSEASEALNMLASLGQTALTSAMARLGQTYKTRLLDNLPASARATSAFTRVLVAMGPGGVEPYVRSLLSYGVFDWAVTDDDAQQVFRIILALPDAGKTTLITRLGAAFRARLISNLQRVATLGIPEQATLRIIFAQVPDGELETLRQLMVIRFRINFAADASNGADWDAAGLRQLWGVLEGLPASMVEGNPDLRSFLRYTQPSGRGAGGVYRSDGDAAMGYDPARLQGPNAANTSADVGDPLRGVNRFNKVVRHEVGHAMEGQCNSASYTSTADGGGWIEESKAGLAGRMVAASAGYINGLGAGDKAAVVGAMQAAIDARAPATVDNRITNLEIFNTAATDAAVATKLTNCKADDAVTQLKQCFETNNPWYDVAGGGLPLGGRIYQEAYANHWVSYANAARARKVSTYQFRAPGEWFAEAFATYYEPGPKGAGLAIDPTTKAWFDAHVDPEHGVGTNPDPGTGPGGAP